MFKIVHKNKTNKKEIKKHDKTYLQIAKNKMIFI